MPIEVTARHMDPSQELMSYAHDKAESLVDQFPRIEHVHVILDEEKHRKIAEVVLQAKNHIRLEAEYTCDDMRAAIDEAMDKIEKQMRKQRDKIQEHRARKADAPEREDAE